MDKNKSQSRRDKSQPPQPGTGSGGIYADHIDTENAVHGKQQIGGDLSQSAKVVALAQALSHGRIQAGSLQAKNVVVGFQYIADPNQTTPDELRQEIARLRQELAEALAKGELEASPDTEDAAEALAKAEEELGQSEPQGGRIVRQLKMAAEILTETVQTAEAAQKAGQALLKLAPAAAALYQIAQKLFGG